MKETLTVKIDKELFEEGQRHLGELGCSVEEYITRCFRNTVMLKEKLIQLREAGVPSEELLEATGEATTHVLASRQARQSSQGNAASED